MSIQCTCTTNKINYKNNKVKNEQVYIFKNNLHILSCIHLTHTSILYPIN